MNSIRRVAVLGAGTMGSRIAAHFANAGIPSLLLDIVAPGAADRNTAAKKGLEAAWKGRPGGFFTDALPALITPGNFEDDLEKIADCDWIIEAVTEKLDVKRELWTRVAAVRTPAPSSPPTRAASRSRSSPMASPKSFAGSSSARISLIRRVICIYAR